MKRKSRNAIAILVILLVFLSAILDKIFGSVSYDVDHLFGQYIFIIFTGLLLVYILNKYLLKNSLSVFYPRKSTFFIDISFALLLLSFYYLMYGFERLIREFSTISVMNQSNMLDLLGNVFSNKYYALFFLGPFIWLSESFIVLVQTLFLNNAWELKSNKYWEWCSIIFTALLISFLQIDKDLINVISAFMMLMAANILYYKYRRVMPLLYAGIIYKTIDFIAIWIYMI